jgi:hypoxanthine-DNA glycosylase
MSNAEGPSTLTGFAPIARPDARVLVLGTAPSRESLRLRQYYGHARNLFWPLMGELFEFDATANYVERCRQLVARGVAVWDVAHRCRRELSADQTIRDVAPNDFAGFLETHQRLRAIFLNGRKAEELFRRLVRPELGAQLDGLHLDTMPSTSPAHAAMTRAAKLERWSVLRDWV